MEYTALDGAFFSHCYLRCWNGFLMYQCFSRMLKKPFHGLFQPRKRKTRFPASFIFNGLQPSKMAALPCTAHRVLKNSVFQHPVKGETTDSMQLFYIPFISFPNRDAIAPMTTCSVNLFHNNDLCSIFIGSSAHSIEWCISCSCIVSDNQIHRRPTDEFNPVKYQNIASQTEQQTPLIGSTTTFGNCR